VADINFDEFDTIFFCNFFYLHKTEEKIIKHKIRIRKKEPMKKELKSFLECVRTGKKPVVSGVEGRRALQVALEIIEKISPSKKS
jgi:predicted dehydrogenase